jgi:hypothetical protein
VQPSSSRACRCGHRDIASGKSIQVSAFGYRIEDIAAAPAAGRSVVELKIGVQSVPREIVIETPMTPDEIEQALTTALDTDGGIFRITDDNGGQVLIPSDKVGYVEIGMAESKRVGFGSM